MWFKDSCGVWKILLEDFRVMVFCEFDEFGGIYYSILLEGIIKNYDGYNIKVVFIKEGIDFNCNYFYEW